MNGVQCYELFGGIALKNHTFSFSVYIIVYQEKYSYIYFDFFFDFALLYSAFYK